VEQGHWACNGLNCGRAAHIAVAIRGAKDFGIMLADDVLDRGPEGVEESSVLLAFFAEKNAGNIMGETER